MPQSHNFEVCDISRFLSHGIYFFWFFWQNLERRKNVEMSQMSQIRSLYRALFRCSADIYVSKLRFAVVWLGQIQNLDTGHVYVLGLKSGSERLLGFSAADSDSSRRLAQLKYEVSDTS